MAATLESEDRQLSGVEAPAAVSRWACLAVAFACTCLTVGNTVAPIAAWLAPLLMLRFVRQSSPVAGLGVALLAQIAAHIIAWHPVLPFEGWLLYALPALIGLVFFVPYVVDRLLTPRLGGFAATLVFPAALVTAEFLFSRAGLGSWGAIAYSQYGNLPLVQVMSVAGLSGITFLVGWVAACANYAWERGWTVRSARLPLLASGALVVAVLVLGGLRLSTSGSGAAVRVAGITVDNLAVFRDTWGPLTTGKSLTEEAAAEARPKTLALQQALLDTSREQARAGARIVVWSEANALVLKDDEAAFIQAGQRLAQEEGVYLFMGMATITPGQPLAENKVVVIDRNGEVLDQYLKSHPTPVEASVRGNGRMGLVDTPYGRLAWAICYDFDFPELIRQAGSKGADIMIDPSWDSAPITPMHSYMSTFRAVENGAALFRQVNDGLSIAVDAQGRTLGQMHHTSVSGPVKTMIVDMPIKGARTLYGRMGDVVPMLSALLLVAFTIRARRGRGA